MINFFLAKTDKFTKKFRTEKEKNALECMKKEISIYSGERFAHLYGLSAFIDYTENSDFVFLLGIIFDGYSYFACQTFCIDGCYLDLQNARCAQINMYKY